jgi:xanthine dehydrogenase accessory factor
MKHEMLQLLVAARRRNQPVVLVRGLTSGRQVLIDDMGAHGDTADVPDQLVQRAKEALRRDGAVTLEVAEERYLLQTLSSPPRLIIIGAVHIAQALIPMARITGYEVQLIDPRAAFASPERFPGTDIINKWPQEIMEELSWDSRTAVVTLSHDAKIDEPALKAALESEAFYIGALGSKNNHAKRLKRLAEHGFNDAALARIAGPIGLPIGGRSPAEIAVSILAQIIQSRQGAVPPT